MWGDQSWPKSFAWRWMRLPTIFAGLISSSCLRKRILLGLHKPFENETHNNHEFVCDALLGDTTRRWVSLKFRCASRGDENCGLVIEIFVISYCKIAIAYITYRRVASNQDSCIVTMTLRVEAQHHKCKCIECLLLPSFMFIMMHGWWMMGMFLDIVAREPAAQVQTNL